MCDSKLRACWTAANCLHPSLWFSGALTGGIWSALHRHYYEINHRHATQRQSVTAITKDMGSSRPTICKYLNIVKEPKYEQVAIMREPLFTIWEIFKANTKRELTHNVRFVEYGFKLEVQFWSRNSLSWGAVECISLIGKSRLHIDYTHLTEDKRYQIYESLAANVLQVAIAKLLRRSASIIFWELQRN